MENVGILIPSRLLEAPRRVLILQMVFMIDLPRLPDGRVANIEDLTFFGEELMHFLRAMGIDEMVIKGVLNFDFRETSNLAFVHTM